MECARYIQKGFQFLAFCNGVLDHQTQFWTDKIFVLKDSHNDFQSALTDQCEMITMGEGDVV